MVGVSGWAQSLSLEPSAGRPQGGNSFQRQCTTAGIFRRSSLALTLGLARAVEQHGGQIYEQTEATALSHMIDGR